ncbi:ricin-type beta-trefoil lectin domain protein [Dactylosporangium sp. NPDC049140]|uniref:ricin-type beta-trefoil lectin domain protein n=1 Tax=Dactylosporangium sp. NPDC049140 TaxID=3155647 RepID=UPI0033E9D4FF
MGGVAGAGDGQHGTNAPISHTPPRPLLAAAALVLATTLGAVAVTAATTGQAGAAANSCGNAFDDFNYGSSGDAGFTGHGWVPRSNAGGPGVPGATWSPGSITFPSSGGQKVMQLTASTDGTGANAVDGNQLQIWDCNGTGTQQWTFNADGSVGALGKCMDVSGGSTADGAVVQLWTCNGTGAQKFTLTAAGDLVNTQANKCVDVENVATANGSKLHLWTCNGASNQKWHR